MMLFVKGGVCDQNINKKSVFDKIRSKGWKGQKWALSHKMVNFSKTVTFLNIASKG